MDPTKRESERHKEYLYAKHKAFLENERVLKSFEKSPRYTRILQLTLKILKNKEVAKCQDQRFFKRLDEAVTDIKEVYKKLADPKLYLQLRPDEEKKIEEICKASGNRALKMNVQIQRRPTASNQLIVRVAPQKHQQQQKQQPALPVRTNPMSTSQQQIQQPTLPVQISPFTTRQQQPAVQMNPMSTGQQQIQQPTLPVQMNPSLFMMMQYGHYMMASAALMNHRPLPPFFPFPPPSLHLPPPLPLLQQPVSDAYSPQSFNIGALQPQVTFGHNPNNFYIDSQPIAQPSSGTYRDQQRIAEQDRQKQAAEEQRKRRQAEQLSRNNSAQCKSQKQSESDTPQSAKKKSTSVGSMVSRPPQKQFAANTIFKKPNIQPKPKNNAAQNLSSGSPVMKRKISNECNLVISNVTSNFKIKRIGQNSEDLKNNPMPKQVKKDPIVWSPPQQIAQEPAKSAVKEELEVNIDEKDTNATIDKFNSYTNAKEISSQVLTMKNSDAASIQEQQQHPCPLQIVDMPSLDVDELQDNQLEIIPLLPPAQIKNPTMKIKKECCI